MPVPAAPGSLVIGLVGGVAAGKSTVANAVDRELFERQRHTYLLDGDNVRHGLNRNLGFSEADRQENIRRIGEVAKLMVDAGLIVSSAFVSPYQRDRDAIRALFNDGEFIEIFVNASLETCEARDPKGLYKKARKGEIKGFTGIDDPYEAPENPELRIATVEISPDEAAHQVLLKLESIGLIR